MPIKSVFLRRLTYKITHPYDSGGSPAKIIAIIALILLAILLISVSVRSFLVEIAGTMAVDDAIDMTTAAINRVIAEKVAEGGYGYDDFVSIQKDGDGSITAISTNMANINTLSAEILQDDIAASNSGEFDMKVPLGSLFGSNLIIGRGPNIPIKILMLTSSHADFRNEFVSTGINQSKHQIMLEITVELNILLPWEIKQTSVYSEVLIAETIIVGKVPDTYLDMHP